MKKLIILSASIVVCAAALAQNTQNQFNTFGYTFYQPGLHTVNAIQTDASMAPNKSAYNTTAIQSNVSYGFNNGVSVFGNIQAGRSVSSNTETVGLVGFPGQEITLTNPMINSSELSTGAQYTVNPELKAGVMVGYINLQNTPATALQSSIFLGPNPYHVPAETLLSVNGNVQFKAVGFEFNPYVQYTPGNSIYAISMDYKNLWFQDNANLNITAPSAYSFLNNSQSTSVEPANHSIFTSINPQYAYKLNSETTVGVNAAAQVTNANFQSLAGLYTQSISNNNLFFMESSLDMLSVKPGITYTPAALKGALQFSLFGGLDAFNYRSCAQVNTTNVDARPYEEYLLITPQVNLTLPIGQNFFFNTMLQMDAYNAINGVSNLPYQQYYTFDKAFHVDANASVALGYYF